MSLECLECRRKVEFAANELIESDLLDDIPAVQLFSFPQFGMAACDISCVSGLFG